LRATLEAAAMSVCAEAQDSETSIAAAVHHRPDVCLVDAALAGERCGHVSAILDAARGVRVVILGHAPSDAELLDAVAAGACGHLPRDLRASRLTAAVRDVLAGRPAFPRRLEALLAAALYRRG
jgi:DNA-binding NarL/FixJ family response regulator